MAETNGGGQTASDVAASQKGEAQKRTAQANGTPTAKPTRDRPWLIRTYSGHSSAAASNALYRTNLARGQTGLSVAFDLPTQTGYDSDHILARGEVGKVGVPVCHLGDMETLFAEIPLDRMNTSMTINAPAAWLLALYVATAERQGAARADLAGTTQNDIFKEYLSRGTHIFPPRPSLKLTTDVIAFTAVQMPKWNPVNVCSYHLQEAGATPVQELAFTLANAMAMLDAVKESGRVADADFQILVGRISFFLNSGIRFITEICKTRAFTRLWEEITRDRYQVEDPRYRRFRYGVQVNSLGLTEQQPENNVYRILLEMLGVVLSKDARARAVQLPAWNEAMGLPRPWDQQWSLRLQQIVAHETDLLEFADIFEGSTVIAHQVDAMIAEAQDLISQIEAQGGAVAAIESGAMKEALVQSNANRIAAIESGDTAVVGVNMFTEGAESPLTQGTETFLEVDPANEQAQIERLNAWREARDATKVAEALASFRAAAQNGDNIMESSIACAHAGVTTGEWTDILRDIFGEYRAPTGMGATIAAGSGQQMDTLKSRLAEIGRQKGRNPRLLMGKPGLDGHSNGAEQVAMRARAAGFDVIYDGIRLTPDQIASAAQNEKADVIGLSILSGSHLAMVGDVLDSLKARGLSNIPVVVGGIIPDEDAQTLKSQGVARVYTPKDYDVTAIVNDLAELVGM